MSTNADHCLFNLSPTPDTLEVEEKYVWHQIPFFSFEAVTTDNLKILVEPIRKTFYFYNSSAAELSNFLTKCMKRNFLRDTFRDPWQPHLKKIPSKSCRLSSYEIVIFYFITLWWLTGGFEDLKEYSFRKFQDKTTICLHSKLN